MSVTRPACTALPVILQVSASSGRRGVYLREPYEVKKSKHNVSITPVFHKDAGGAVWAGLCGWGSEVCGNVWRGNVSGVLGNNSKGCGNEYSECCLTKSRSAALFPVPVPCSSGDEAVPRPAAGSSVQPVVGHGP